jgi:hypothetical protein
VNRSRERRTLFEGVNELLSVFSTHLSDLFEFRFRGYPHYVTEMLRVS